VKVLMATLCVLIVLGLSLPSAGCASKPVPSGFLGDYTGFAPGPDGIDLFYSKPGADLSQYDKVMLDHVKVRFAPGAEHAEIDPDQLKQLADYFEEALIEAVKESHKLVAEPGPGALRLRTAITQLQPGTPVVHGVTSVVPVGLVATTVQSVTTGTYLAAGEVTVEWEVLDSQSNERLRAGVDRRFGQRYDVVGGFTEWGQVESAFRRWANLARKRLVEAKKAGSN
jgi:hypothetical protein